MSRSVIKIRKSLYVCLPSAICEELKIGKGDCCRFLLLPGYGLLIQKQAEREETGTPLEGLACLQDEADKIFQETRRKIRGLENQAVSNVWMKIFGLALKEGIIPIYPPSPSNQNPQGLIPEKTKAIKD